MRTQQQAERAEQQRIKNLVLNYDLRNDDDANDGGFANLLQLNMNRMQSAIAKQRSTSSSSSGNVAQPQPLAKQQLLPTQSVEFNNLPTSKGNMSLSPHLPLSIHKSSHEGNKSLAVALFPPLLPSSSNQNHNQKKMHVIQPGTGLKSAHPSPLSNVPCNTNTSTRRSSRRKYVPLSLQDSESSCENLSAKAPAPSI